MTKRNAAVEVTGGEGFNFEDYVAAKFLLGLLGVPHPLGSDLGRLTRIDWQARENGWRLDDLALTFGSGDHERSAGLSIKSDKQVTESGFAPSFTEACWQQWLGVGTGRTLRVDRDLMVLVTGVLADGVRAAWEKTLAEAIATTVAPERLVARLIPTNTNGPQSNEMQRDLFQSLHCPSSLRTVGIDDITAARLLRHIRLVYLDFESTLSRAKAEALIDCQAVIFDGTAETAQALWGSLLRIAALKRGRGGSIDLPELLVRLHRYALKDHPDYQGEWIELDRRSQERYEAIGMTVGNAAKVRRSSKGKKLLQHLRANQTCVVVGESGVGKSAFVREFGGRRYRLVWLTGDQLHSGREPTFEQQLGIRRSFTQVVEASPTRCLVVFDGVEGYSEPGLQLVARLTNTLRHGNARIALTVQPDGVARLQAAFAAARVPMDSMKPLVIRKPSEVAIERMLASFPSLAWASLRPEFRSLLRNLKIFDWVVRLQSSGGLTDPAALESLTALIDQLWRYFVETGPDGFARAALLKRIAALEADNLSQGLPLSEFDIASLALIPSLESLNLVRVHDDRVRFVHDMFADWARLKYLVEQRLVDSDSTICRAATAGWYRSVRLYAQRVLESPGDGLAIWQQCVQALGVGNSERIIIRDLFLEALVLTNDASRLLTIVWPVLVAGDGEILSLLLNRFAFVGTVADWRVLSSLENPERLQHLVRVPLQPYWHGVLSVLEKNPGDVIRCAMAPTAKLLRLWLSMVSPAKSATRHLRNAAAKLALIVAREVQAQEAEDRRSIEQEVKTDVFVAVLWSAPEYADEVAQLCLELATRQPESETVRLRRKTAREESNRMQQLETNSDAAELMRPVLTPEDIFGSKPVPWPDGPKHRVDEAFQKACLNCQAIMPLVINRPDAALEVLLSVIIGPPRIPRWSEVGAFGDSLGLDHNQLCHPAFYHQGPFLYLLRVDPETAKLALTLILQVVNFATEQWQDRQRQLLAKYSDHLAEGPFCVTIPTPEGWKECLGDRNVLRWHEGWRTDSTVLSSMLMAVEKWLYDEADAGRPLDRWVERILAEGRSAAFIGILVDLGKYKPGLLAGPLRSLVGSPEIYIMEGRLRFDPVFSFWSMHWSGFGENAWNRARDWYAMPHRKVPFANLVMHLVFENVAIQAEMLPFYRQWEKRCETEPKDTALQGLISYFGVAIRYIRAVADGEEQLQAYYAWLKSQQQEAKVAQQKNDDKLMPIVLASKCRKQLDEDHPLTPEELNSFWDRLQGLAALPQDSAEGGTRPVDSVMGGVAVLLILHRDWLREHDLCEKWCRDQLQLCLEQPPSRGPFDSADSAGNWDWDSTMRRAYRLNAKLGDGFARIRAFVAEWSACLWFLEWSQKWRLDSERLWKEECEPRIESFIEGAQQQPSRMLADIDAAGRFRIRTLFAAYCPQSQRSTVADENEKNEENVKNDDEAFESHEFPSARRGVPTTWPGLDFDYLLSACAWLDIALKEESVTEDSLVAIRDLLTVSLRSVPSLSGKTHRWSPRFPSRFDQWLYPHIAGILLQRGGIGQAGDLWRPILSLGGRGEWWVKYFLADWHRAAARPTVRPEEFVVLWEQMIRLALADPDWEFGRAYSSSEASNLVNELLGFSTGRLVFGSDGRYANPIGGLSPVFALAADRWFNLGKVAAAFCRFAVTPAGVNLLLPGIGWLAVAEPGWSDWAWEHENLAEVLVNLLRLTLDRHRTVITADPGVRGEFFSLCNRLLALGHHAALTLREQAAASDPQP